MKEKAFTLIELLIVVLIIGIVTAVALPQYQKAVTRAKNREALLTLRTIERGLEMYNLANGALPSEETEDFSVFGIENPSSKNWGYHFFCLEGKSCLISAFEKRNKEIEVGLTEYTLSVWTNEQGKLEFPVTVQETKITEMEQPDETTAVVSSVIRKASEETCKRAAGRMDVKIGCVID